MSQMSEHPVDPSMRAEIQERLSAIEAEHGRPLPALNAYIDAELTRLESVLPPVAADTDFSVLDNLLLDVVLTMPAEREVNA
jgi:hypothetical protein